MEIKNRLDALHAMATMRRMEISGEDQTNSGDAVWRSLFEACENFFGANDPVLVAFSEN